MLHRVPEATLKPICLQFMPKTAIGNVFIMQVHWEAVPNMWPSSSKASVAKCVMCAWNSAQSDVTADMWN